MKTKGRKLVKMPTRIADVSKKKKNHCVLDQEVAHRG
jgi:hypothetical protein